MSTITLPITGGCFCGATRFQVNAQPVDQYYCHCSKCRGYSGAPVTVGITFPLTSFDLVSGEPQFFDTSPEYERMTCSSCWSLLGGRQTGAGPKLVAIRLGCMDDPDAFAPEKHIFTSSQLSWLIIADDLPRYKENGPE